MRQHLSILMLAARGNLCKLLLLLAGMAAAEAGLFVLSLREHAAGIAADQTVYEAAVAAGEPNAWELGRYANTWSLEEVFTGSHVALVFAAGLVVLCILLCTNGTLTGRAAYTTRRLSVGQRAMTVWTAVYNLIALVIFWAAQVVLAFILCQVFLTRADPAALSAQTVFLAFYRQDFLHSLLPLADLSRWLRNGVLAICLAVTCACFTYRLRHGRRGMAAIVLAVMAAFAFSRSLGSWSLDLAVALTAAGAACVVVGNLKEVREHAD